MGSSHTHFETLGATTLSFFMAIKEHALGLNFVTKLKIDKFFFTLFILFDIPRGVSYPSGL